MTELQESAQKAAFSGAHPLDIVMSAFGALKAKIMPVTDWARPYMVTIELSLVSSVTTKTTTTTTIDTNTPICLSRDHEHKSNQRGLETYTGYERTADLAFCLLVLVQSVDGHADG